MPTTVYLKKSNKPDKKYMVTIGNKTIHFGARGMSDYTKHKDKARMQRYMSRHKRRENWSGGGIKTAGFWSKWLLWNKPSLGESIKSIEKRFGVKIVRGGGSAKSKSTRKSKTKKSKSRKSKTRR